MSRAAIAVCATLCANPPAALTPMTEKRCVLFSSAITARLREAPDTLYMNIVGPPPSIDEIMTRVMSITMASRVPRI